MQKFSIYLDQNIISYLLPGSEFRDALLTRFQLWQGKGAVCVVSDVNIRESRSFGDPEMLAGVTEEIGVFYLDDKTAEGGGVTLVHGVAAGKIREAESFYDTAIATLESTLRVMHHVGAHDTGMTAPDLNRLLEEQWHSFFNALASEIPPELHGLMPEHDPQIMLSPEQLDRVAAEGKAVRETLEYRQGDPRHDPLLMSAGEVAAWLFSVLPTSDAEALHKEFPRDFWSDPARRSSNTLCALAFCLAELGVLRPKALRKGSDEERWKAYRAQFRDCEHIGNAAWCTAFATADAGAARLARAAYSWGGVPTEVSLLGFPKHAHELSLPPGQSPCS